MLVIWFENYVVVTLVQFWRSICVWKRRDWYLMKNIKSMHVGTWDSLHAYAAIDSNMNCAVVFKVIDNKKSNERFYFNLTDSLTPPLYLVIRFMHAKIDSRTLRCITTQNTYSKKHSYISLMSCLIWCSGLLLDVHSITNDKSFIHELIYIFNNLVPIAFLHFHPSVIVFVHSDFLILLRILVRSSTSVSHSPIR